MNLFRVDVIFNGSLSDLLPGREEGGPHPHPHPHLDSGRGDYVGSAICGLSISIQHLSPL